MKKLLFSVTALMLTSVLFAQKADDVAKFKTEVIDMGKIKQSNPTTAVFSVTNVGKTPLIIEQANPTCGCTIGDYTKEPIAVGKSGEIKATYNAAGLGAFEKHLTVKFAGVDEIKSITIKGEVLSADDFAKLQPATPVVAPAAVTDTKVKTTTVTKPGKKTKTKTKSTPATASRK